MDDLGKDPVAASFTMLTERLSAVEALTEVTRAKVEGTNVLLTTVARQALRSRCQEVVDPELMFLDQDALGGARVTRLLSALEGSSQAVLICVRREDGEQLRSACTTGGLTVQEQWDWFRREAGPRVAAGQPAQWMAAAAPPPLFLTQPEGGLHYTMLDRVINGPLLRSIQPSIVSPALPAGVQVLRELTNSLMVCEPGHVSSSFQYGARLGFHSDVPMFVDQWLQLVLPALQIGAGQALSVAILDMAKAPRSDSLPSSIASRLFENELMPDELMFPEEEEEGEE